MPIPDSQIELNLPIHPSGITDPVLYEELILLYGAVQALQAGIDSLVRGKGIYDATITYGRVVNILDTAGVSHVRLASASAPPYPALGFCPTLAGVASGTPGEVQTIGKITNLTGLTPGAIYYLSDTTPGSYQTTKPVGAGKIVQPVGFALDATTLYFKPTLLYTQL